MWIAQSGLWTNGSEKHQVPRFIPRKSWSWSWKKLPGPEWALPASQPARKAASTHPLGNSRHSADVQPGSPAALGPAAGGDPRSPPGMFTDRVPDAWQLHFLLYSLPVPKATVAFSIIWKLICCFKIGTCPKSLSLSLCCKHMQDVYDSKQQECWGVSPALIKAGSSYNFTHVELSLLI